MPFQRLHPDPAPATPTEAAAAVELGRLAREDRPHLVLNMVSTADGRATLHGRTRDLSSEADRELFHELRARAGAVMVGAGTARIERYGRIAKRAGLRERRAAEGLDPDPLACVVSGRLSLPDDLPLLREPEQRVVVVTAAAGELPPACAARIEYWRSPTGPEVDLPAALAWLRRERGVRSVVCEGGPTLNGALLRAGLVDELLLSVAPLLAGGGLAGGAGADPLAIVAGAPLPEPVRLEPVSIHESDGHLFLRYSVRRDSA